VRPMAVIGEKTEIRRSRRRPRERPTKRSGPEVQHVGGIPELCAGHEPGVGDRNRASTRTVGERVGPVAETAVMVAPDDLVTFLTRIAPQRTTELSTPPDWRRERAPSPSPPTQVRNAECVNAEIEGAKEKLGDTRGRPRDSTLRAPQPIRIPDIHISCTGINGAKTADRALTFPQSSAGRAAGDEPRTTYFQQRVILAERNRSSAATHSSREKTAPMGTGEHVRRFTRRRWKARRRPEGAGR